MAAESLKITIDFRDVFAAAKVTLDALADTLPVAPDVADADARLVSILVSLFSNPSVSIDTLMINAFQLDGNNFQKHSIRLAQNQNGLYCCSSSRQQLAFYRIILRFLLLFARYLNPPSIDQRKSRLGGDKIGLNAL